MPKITLEVSEELSEQLAQLGDRLPALLALSLQQPALSAHIYSTDISSIFLPAIPHPSKLLSLSPPMKCRNA